MSNPDDDLVLREADTGGALLDSDGEVLRELEIEAVDEVVDHGATIQELAAGARAWRYGHVIVDEAQDLTPMQWRMVTRRTRGSSLTIVGDLAQRSIGEPGSWREHLPPAIAEFDYRELSVNYRSPASINRLAGSVLSELAPDLAPTEAIRDTATPPQARSVTSLGAELPAIVEEMRQTTDGTVAVIAADPERAQSALAEDSDAGVHWLSPWKAKGLEFDAVVLVEPAEMLAMPRGLSLLYVALTRSTNRLVIVHAEPLPSCLARTGL